MPKKPPLSPVEELASLEWRVRECRFDRSVAETINFRLGEVVIDSLNDVEDTKGNNGQSGRLIVTNLRVIWSVGHLFSVPWSKSASSQHSNACAFALCL